MIRTQIKRYFLNKLIGIYMKCVKLLLWNKFINRTHNPINYQTNVLKEILIENENTFYGKLYGFSKIKTYKDFCSKIPVITYEDIRKYIEKQERTKQPILTKNLPEMYTLTSGTTGRPKYIPVLSKTIKNYKRNHKIFSYTQYSNIPGIYTGSILAMASPAFEGYLDAGTPYGSLSGLIYRDLPNIIKSKYVIPPEVFELNDYELKYRIILALSLLDKSISVIACANPSTLLKLSEVMNSSADDLLYIIKNGDTKDKKIAGYKLSETSKILASAKEKRIEELERIFRVKEKVYISDTWPNLKAVVTWTNGSCGLLIPLIKDQLPENTEILEMGYFASEFMGSLLVDAKENRTVPTYHDNFFEFVEKNDWECNRQNFLRLHEIVEGNQYYIIVTTQSGLYRYFINDIIEVTGKYNDTPTIKFVQKGKGVTNITGEKLYEYQILKTIEMVSNMHGINLDFFIMVADEKELKYTLYLEHSPLNGIDIFSEVENNLMSLNIEYKAKRESGRLKPLNIEFIKDGTSEIYKRNCIDSGQRESQFKFVYLQYKKDCNFNFKDFAYR